MVGYSVKKMAAFTVVRFTVGNADKLNAVYCRFYRVYSGVYCSGGVIIPWRRV